MKKGLIFSLAGLFVFLIIALAFGGKSAGEYNRDAMKAEYYSDYDTALKLYTKAIKRAPDNAAYFVFRGELYAKKGKFALAIADLDEALRLNPSHWKALGLRANALEQVGDLEGALADFTDRIQISRLRWENGNYSLSSIEALDERAKFYLRQEEFEKAIQDFTEVAKLSFSESFVSKSKWFYFQNAYDNIAQIHVRQGEFEKAIQDFTEMAELTSPQSSDTQDVQALAYYRIAQIHLRQGEFEKAIQNFTIAMEYPTKYLPAAYYWRGTAYREAGAFEKAIADFTEAWERKPDDKRAVEAYEFAEAYSQRGVAYMELGDLDKAIADFTEAILLNPILATEEKRSSNWSNNDILTQRMIISRMELRSYSYRGSSAGVVGRGVGAAMNILNAPARQRALNEARDISAAMADLAWLNGIIDRGSRNSSGVNLWPTPDFAAAHTRRGLVYFEKEDYGLAIADFEDALRIDPDNFVAWEQLEAALSFDPDHPFASEILNMAKNQ